MKLGHPAYSPFDIRMTIRVVGGLLVWRVLSMDYTNLVELAKSPRPAFTASVQFARVSQALEWAAARVLVDDLSVRATQLGLCLGLVAALTVLNRWAVLLAVTLLGGFLGYAAQFSAPMFESDLAVFYLLLVTCWPARWDRMVHGDRTVTPAATGFGCAFLFTLGIWYFFAGLSKVLADPEWAWHVHIEHMYRALEVIGGIDPEAMKPSRAINAVLSAAPWLGTASSATVLGLELAWPLAAFSRRARRILIPAMLVFHFGFFLMCGTLFLTLAVLLVAATVPWRRVLPGAHVPAAPAGGHQPRLPRRAMLLMAFLVAAHAACAVEHRNYYPYLNWCVFGWKYPSFEQPVEINRLGYRDPETGAVVPIPQGIGGFMESRYIAFANSLTDQYLSEPDPSRRATLMAATRNLLAGRRDAQSNRWLLGPFALPGHLTVVPPPSHIPADAQFYFMRGVVRYDGERVTVTWTRLELIPSGPSAGTLGEPSATARRAGGSQ